MAGVFDDLIRVEKGILLYSEAYGKIESCMLIHNITPFRYSALILDDTAGGA